MLDQKAGVRVSLAGADATNSHQSLASRVINTGTESVLLDQVTRRVWKEQKADSKNETPGELDADRNAVLAGVLAVADSIVDTSRDQETEGDGELVSGDESTTHFLGANLGHVQDDNGGLETDTDTGNSTTSNQKIAAGSSNLQNDTWRARVSLDNAIARKMSLTNDVDHAAHDDGPLAANHVGDVTGQDGTHEGTSRKNGDNERGVAAADGTCVARVADTRALDLGLEEVGTEHTVDVTRIVSC